MANAIDRALCAVERAETSIFTGVLHRHPTLDIAVLPEPFVLAISRAIATDLANRILRNLLSAAQRVRGEPRHHFPRNPRT